MIDEPSAAEIERRERERKQSDEWCARMSELMLKGWKMLGENCPETGTVPLMQHPKNGRKFSVALNKYIDELTPAAGTDAAGWRHGLGAGVGGGLGAVGSQLALLFGAALLLGHTPHDG